MADKGTGMLLYALGLSWLVVALVVVDRGTTSNLMECMTMSVLQIALGSLRILTPWDEARGLGEPFVIHAIAGSFTTGLLLGTYPPWLAGVNSAVHAMMVFVTHPGRGRERDVQVAVGIEIPEGDRPVVAEPVQTPAMETA
jgi:hypothetical protein